MSDTTDKPIEGMSHPLVQDLMLNPKGWKIWPAVAILRWIIGKSNEPRRRLVYRSRAALCFATSEIDDVAIQGERLELTLNAVGLASAGSPLPTPDIMRVIEDARRGGAISEMLDGPGDRLMHALEGMLAKNHTPFALITGGQVDAFGLVSDIVGRSAPLSAKKNGVLFETRWRIPEGAIGLASGFVGPASTQGLARIMEAFTGLPTHIEEFTGREVLVARPARVGRHIGGMLGVRCRMATAGIEIHLDAGTTPNAKAWGIDRQRVESLHRLAAAYLGGPQTQAEIMLWVEGGNAPLATLDGTTALGGIAILGKVTQRTVVALRLA